VRPLYEALAFNYLEASINRIVVYAIGLCFMCKVVPFALLDPATQLRKLEAASDTAGRLVLQEDMCTIQFGAVWDQLCEGVSRPLDRDWMTEVRHLEWRTLSLRA